MNTIDKMLSFYQCQQCMITDDKEQCKLLEASGLVEPILKSANRPTSGVSFFGAHTDNYSLNISLIRDGKGDGELRVGKIFGEASKRKAFLKSLHKDVVSDFGRSDSPFFVANVGDTTQPGG